MSRDQLSANVYSQPSNSTQGNRQFPTNRQFFTSMEETDYKNKAIVREVTEGP